MTDGSVIGSWCGQRVEVDGNRYIFSKDREEINRRLATIAAQNRTISRQHARINTLEGQAVANEKRIIEQRKHINELLSNIEELKRGEYFALNLQLADAVITSYGAKKLVAPKGFAFTKKFRGVKNGDWFLNSIDGVSAIQSSYDDAYNYRLILKKVAE